MGRLPVKPIHRVERFGQIFAMDVLGAPLDQREGALVDLRARCYSIALAQGISPRNARRWAEKTERLTRGIVEIIQLRL